MRIAAIDIGTNSIHMVIADALALGTFEVVDREREVVQIGRGSFARGRLRREAIQRSVDALARFTQLARRLQSDRILCTATAAVREARNGGEFVQAARAAAGITPRVIPAEEEGRLIHLAVRAALQLGPDPALIVDIGGGSMQLVVGNGDRLERATSAPLGALRLAERFLEADPPTRGEVQRLRRHIRKQARKALARVAECSPKRAYGSSGSILALAQAAHGEEHGEPIAQMNGHVLERAALTRLTRRLTRMTLAQRERLPGIDPRRAEIILPGALVLLHVLEALDLESITVSDFGVREGLVTDYIANHAMEVSQLAPIDDLRQRSVVQLMSKFQTNATHAEHVTRLALALWDGFRDAHELPVPSRELLRYAALLHDIGSVVAFDGHAVHSAYIVRNGNLRGLSADEVQVVACVAAYHGKAAPRRRDPAYGELAKPLRRTVRWLAALLRIAEGLDRSHYQLIKSLRVVRRGHRHGIVLTARRDAKLELWAARQRTGLLLKLMRKVDPDAVLTVRLDRAVEPRRTEEGARRPEAPARRASSPRLKMVARR